MTTRHIWVVVGLVLLTMALALGAAHYELSGPVIDIATPPFAVSARPPLRDSLTAIDGHLHRVAGHQWIRQLAPNQGGALWIAVCVVLVVAGANLVRSGLARDLWLAQLPAWLLFGTLDIYAETDKPAFVGWVQFMFELVAGVSVAIWARALWLEHRSARSNSSSLIGRPHLRALAVVLLALNLVVIFIDEPDDSSFFVNLGGQRLRERGRLPYGDPLLTGTPGAAYPPLLYVAHAAVQSAIAAPTNEPVEDVPRLGPASNYGSLRSWPRNWSWQRLT